jgi:hypothetical protein
MIRAGKFCTACGSGCFDAPSPAEPGRINCVRCHGKGCDLCGGRGWTFLESCPQRIIAGETRDFIDAAAFAAEGLMPVGGGMLDQADSFMRALRFFRDEESSVKGK